MSGSYTQAFSENHAVLAKLFCNAVSTEQNTTLVNLSKYHAVAVVVHAGLVGTTLDIDIEVATDESLANLFTIESVPQLGGSDDGDLIIIEMKSEKLGHPTGAPAENYDWMRVELTPSGNFTGSVIVYGLTPRFAPVPLTLVDRVVTVST